MRLTQQQSQILTAIYWHRLLSTDQITRMLTPYVRSNRSMQKTLQLLRTRGLIANVAVNPYHARQWYCTDAGADCVEANTEIPVRSYRMTADKAAGALQAHTSDVIETGLAFIETARRLGHECGALSWTPEVAHRVANRAPGERFSAPRELVIADAVLHYVATSSPRRQFTFCVELDRATMPVTRLAAKLRQYARMLTYTAPGSTRPVWRDRYPSFPRVLIVLSGADSDVLDRRLGDLRAQAAALPALVTHRRDLTILATTLQRLQVQGADADIWIPVLGDPIPQSAVPSAAAERAS